MFYYKILLELLFYGIILFGIIVVFVNIYTQHWNHRRNIRKSLRIIKNWY
jgi:hypothetical protein